MNARGTRRPHVRRVKSRPRVKSGGKSGCALVLIALAILPALIGAGVLLRG